MSFFGTRAVSASPLSEEKEAKTGISVETTEEILLKKIRARMLRGSEYLSRDAYDFVVAHIKEPEAIDRVFDGLRPEERAMLRFDAESASFRLADDSRVLAPAYPGLLQPIGNLESFLRDALNRRLDADRLRRFA